MFSDRNLFSSELDIDLRRLYTNISEKQLLDIMSGNVNTVSSTLVGMDS